MKQPTVTDHLNEDAIGKRVTIPYVSSRTGGRVERTGEIVDVGEPDNHQRMELDPDDSDTTINVHLDWRLAKRISRHNHQ